MPTKKPYMFDLEKFTEMLEILQVEEASMAKMFSVTTRTIQNKKAGRVRLTINDFLTISNALGLDPTKFFVQKEKV